MRRNEDQARAKVDFPGCAPLDLLISRLPLRDVLAFKDVQMNILESREVRGHTGLGTPLQRCTGASSLGQKTPFGNWAVTGLDEVPSPPLCPDQYYLSCFVVIACSRPRLTTITPASGPTENAKIMHRFPASLLHLYDLYLPRIRDFRC